MTTTYTTESDYSGLIVAIIIVIGIILFGLFIFAYIVTNVPPKEKLPITDINTEQMWDKIPFTNYR